MQTRGREITAHVSSA